MNEFINFIGHRSPSKESGRPATASADKKPPPKPSKSGLNTSAIKSIAKQGNKIEKYVSPFILDAQKLAKQRAAKKLHGRKSSRGFSVPSPARSAPTAADGHWNSDSKTPGLFDPSIKRAEIIPKKSQYPETSIKKFVGSLGQLSPGSITSDDVLESYLPAGTSGAPALTRKTSSVKKPVTLPTLLVICMML